MADELPTDDPNLLEFDTPDLPLPEPPTLDSAPVPIGPPGVATVQTSATALAGDGEAVQEITLGDLLAGTPLFSGLANVHLDRLAAIGAEETFKRNARIFSEGEAGDRFYLILEGQVRVSRTVPGMGEEALAILSAGDYFGEMALIDDAPRSADAIGHEPGRLFVIRKADLEDLMFVDRELAYELLWNFVRTLTGRLREMNNKLTFLSTTAKF